MWTFSRGKLLIDICSGLYLQKDWIKVTPQFITILQNYKFHDSKCFCHSFVFLTCTILYTAALETLQVKQ